MSFLDLHIFFSVGAILQNKRKGWNRKSPSHLFSFKILKNVNEIIINKYSKKMNKYKKV